MLFRSEEGERKLNPLQKRRGPGLSQVKEEREIVRETVIETARIVAEGPAQDLNANTDQRDPVQENSRIAAEETPESSVVGEIAREVEAVAVEVMSVTARERRIMVGLIRGSLLLRDAP